MGKIQVIFGSTRQGRMGEKVSAWVMNQLKNIPGAEYEFLDLRDWPLPFFDEPVSPSMVPFQFIHPEGKRWSDKIQEGSGYIFITPEYNHGYPAILKNVLDYLYKEWNGKPAGFVSYGGFAGGVRASEQLVQVVNELQMITVRERVAIPAVWAAFDESGNLVNGEMHVKNLQAMVAKMMQFVK